MKKGVVFSTLILFFFLACCGTQHKQNKFKKEYLNSVKLGKTNFTETIHFEKKLGLLIIPVKIKNKTYQFLFDTGAPTVISPEISKAFPSIEKKKRQITITDASGVSNQEVISILPKLSINSLDFLHIGTVIKDLSSFQSRCITIDGIFGANVMRKCVWKIDYKKQLIYFSNKKQNILIQNPEVTLQFKENTSGSPVIPMGVSGVFFQTTCDTGFNGDMQITDSLEHLIVTYNKNMPIIKGKGISDYTFNLNKSHQVRDIYKTKLDSVILISNLSEGNKQYTGFLVKNIPSEIVHAPAEVLIGNEIMENAGQILFDWKNHQIIMEKSPNSENQKTFGFAPFLANGVIKVIKLWDNSKVKKEGLEIGDTIVSINGRDVKNISQETLCDNIEEYENLNSIKFKVKKGNSTKSYSIKKYGLFE